MIDTSLFSKNCDAVFDAAAAESHRLGLPTVGWDKKTKTVVKTWPDGRKETIEPNSFEIIF